MLSDPETAHRAPLLPLTLTISCVGKRAHMSVRALAYLGAIIFRATSRLRIGISTQKSCSEVCRHRKISFTLKNIVKPDNLDSLHALRPGLPPKGIPKPLVFQRKSSAKDISREGVLKNSKDVLNEPFTEAKFVHEFVFVEALRPRRRLVRARVAALSGLQRPLTLIKQIIKTPESLLFYLFVLKITFFCRWRARSPIEFCPRNAPL